VIIIVDIRNRKIAISSEEIFSKKHRARLREILLLKKNQELEKNSGHNFQKVKMNKEIIKEYRQVLISSALQRKLDLRQKTARAKAKKGKLDEKYKSQITLSDMNYEIDSIRVKYEKWKRFEAKRRFPIDSNWQKILFIGLCFFRFRELIIKRKLQERKKAKINKICMNFAMKNRKSVTICNKRLPDSFSILHYMAVITRNHAISKAKEILGRVLKKVKFNTMCKMHLECYEEARENQELDSSPVYLT